MVIVVGYIIPDNSSESLDTQILVRGMKDNVHEAVKRILQLASQKHPTQKVAAAPPPQRAISSSPHLPNQQRATTGHFSPPLVDPKQQQPVRRPLQVKISLTTPPQNSQSKNTAKPKKKEKTITTMAPMANLPVGLYTEPAPQKKQKKFDKRPDLVCFKSKTQEERAQQRQEAGERRKREGESHPEAAEENKVEGGKLKVNVKVKNQLHEKAADTQTETTEPSQESDASKSEIQSSEEIAKPETKPDSEPVTEEQPKQPSAQEEEVAKPQKEKTQEEIEADKLEQQIRLLSERLSVIKNKKAP